MWPLVGNLATKFKIWSSGGATCIGSNVVHQVGSHFGHQMATLGSKFDHHACIATLPGIALLALSVGIDLVSSSARVTSVKFQKHLVS